jgi:hypothetical protein
LFLKSAYIRTYIWSCMYDNVVFWTPKRNYQYLCIFVSRYLLKYV